MSFRPWRFVAVLVLTAAVTPHAAAQVYSTDFETNPANYGWYSPFLPNNITTAYAYSGTHSLNLAQGLLYSPLLDVYQTNQFIEVDFHALNPQGNQDSARAVFANGVSILQLGQNWTTNSWIFRFDGTPNQRIEWEATNAAIPVYIDDAVLQPVTPAWAAHVQDTNFANLMPKPFTYTPPADRQNFMPNSMAKLASGQTLNVAMVGDSIMNDTYSSAFNAMAERHTGGIINTHGFFSGGAGPTYWAQNNQIAGIMATNPDLLMFGGISQQNDIPSLRSIIQQARAVNPAIEIVLVSPVAGSDDNPFTDPTLLSPADPAGTSYRSQLIQLAAEQDVQYWDLTTPWAQYIYNSGLGYGTFLRDGIHDSGFGEMLEAAMMESFFTPAPLPEPGTLVLTGLAGAAGLAARRRKRSAAAAQV
jgi:hypothetical protein